MDIDNISKDLEQIKQDLKAHEKRLADIESDKKLQLYQYESIMKCMSEMKADIKEIKERPIEKWDLIIASLLSACVGYFCNKLLK